jgi:hypothetical protein
MGRELGSAPSLSAISMICAVFFDGFVESRAV